MREDLRLEVEPLERVALGAGVGAGAGSIGEVGFEDFRVVVLPLVALTLTVLLAAAFEVSTLALASLAVDDLARLEVDFLRVVLGFLLFLRDLNVNTLLLM